ncbi:unnamed protein product [Linum trigynum]|uniref:RNA helicase n=1 Tax=Linum trigynum TaxID=586398 RepID=A0AAV2D2Y4_9ROSI
MEDVKHKSGKEEDSKRSHRDKERNGDKHRSSRRSERKKTIDSDSKYEREQRSKEKDSRSKDNGKERHGRDRKRHRDGEEKDRDKNRDREKEKHKSGKEEDSKRSHRDKERNGDKHRSSSRRSDREKSVDSDSKYEREKEKDRKKRSKEKYRRSKDDVKERHGGDRKRDRDGEEKDRDRDRDREKEKEKRRKAKEHQREEREKKERDRKGERGREEKERDKKDREKERRRREKHRGYSSSDYSDDDDSKMVHRDKKRRKRESEDHKERTREVSKSSKHKDDGDGGGSSPLRKVAAVAVDVQEVKESGKTREEELEDERKSLDDEVEKRRRRVQEWQELKRKKEESELQKLGESGPTDELKAGKTWTLEGESDDEDAMGKADNEMDVDDNLKPDGETKVAMAVDAHEEDDSAATEAPQAEEDEDIDPLDAFMNNMVLPEVEKLNSAAVSDSDGVDLGKKDVKTEAKRNREQQSKKGSNKSLGRIIQGEDSDSDYGDIDNDEKASEDEDHEESMKRVKKTKAEKLSLVDHSKIDYKPFRKNFYIEVKEITRMTLEEVSAHRKELELKIHGKDVPKPIKTWHQTGLTTKIMDTIRKLNFEEPMSIQAQALPVIMSGRDCIGIAKTGSGKTLAIVLPMLRHIKDQPPVEAGDGPVGMIIAPTRELVQQIHSDIIKFTKPLGLRCVPVYGGSGVAQQISELKRGTEIVVCTPGRMIDILCTSGGKITNLRRVTYLVMDEADRMFDMGFEPQITRIVQNIRPDRQTVLFSATFPRQVEILARKVLNKPVEIQVGGRSVVNKDITQLAEIRPENERIFRLLELLGEWYDKGKILVFVQSQDKCDMLYKEMMNVYRYPCLSLHGAKDQTDRESTISDFKNNVCNLLDDLKALADGFMAKVNQGLEQAHGTGYGGSGFKFNEEEDEKRMAAKKAQVKEYGFEEDKSDSEDEDEGIRKTGNNDLGQLQAARAQQMAALAVASVPPPAQLLSAGGVPAAAADGMARAQALAAARNLQHNLLELQADALPEHYEAELEINDFPQNARWKVTHKETLGPISEWTGAAITTRGQYFGQGRVPGPGERKLYLFIEGPNEVSVKRAKEELKCVLEEITSKGFSVPGGAQTGRYSVV